jgi:hypothetical protein
MTRGGAVHYVDAASYELNPGVLVVVAVEGEERLATVVIGTGQIIDLQGEMTPVGRVVRAADPGEIRTYGRRAARELEIASRLGPRLADAGAEVVDAWLTPDGARAVIVLGTAPVRADAISRELTVLLGIDVELRARTGAETSQSLSGATGAGLPAGWAEWMVPMDAEPSLSRSTDQTSFSLADAFIARLFPGEDEWPPPRPRRSQRR